MNVLSYLGWVLDYDMNIVQYGEWVDIDKLMIILPRNYSYVLEGLAMTFGKDLLKKKWYTWE